MVSPFFSPNFAPRRDSDSLGEKIEYNERVKGGEGRGDMWCVFLFFSLLELDSGLFLHIGETQLRLPQELTP